MGKLPKKLDAGFMGSESYTVWLYVTAETEVRLAGPRYCCGKCRKRRGSDRV